MKLLVILLCLISISCHADNRYKVETIGPMMYQQKLSKIVYLVDAMIQVCYFRGWGNGSTLSVFNCALLAKRKEWQPIITWVKP